MNKPWLLIVNFDYYPRVGTADWINRFDTEEEAKEYSLKIKASGESHTIVNLETWGMDE